MGREKKESKADSDQSDSEQAQNTATAEEDPDPVSVQLPAAADLAHILNLVSYLSSHGPFKMTTLQLLKW